MLSRLNKPLLFIMITLITLCSSPVWSQSVSTDSVQPRGNLINRTLRYFEQANKKKIGRKLDFNFIGGPHYSSDTKFGIGVVAAGLYRTCETDTLNPPSNISLTGDITTGDLYLLGLSGTHIFPHDSQRINANVYLYSFRTKFWGIGYEQDHNDLNETRYHDLKVMIDADWQFKTGRNLFIGPMVGVNYFRGSGMDNIDLWQGQKLAHTSVSVGGCLRYDTRDHLTNPYRGWLLNLEQKFYPRFLFNGDYGFSSTLVAANFYFQAWAGGVVASRFHSLFTYGHTPWGMLATIGGRNLRGYYEGRYRNKSEADLTVELRQHVYRRSGIALWLGVGTIFDRFSDIHFSRLLPNVGIGYRWEFKQRTNVRIDFGVGRNCSGIEFNINEAF